MRRVLAALEGQRVSLETKRGGVLNFLNVPSTANGSARDRPFHICIKRVLGFNFSVGRVSRHTTRALSRSAALLYPSNPSSLSFGRRPSQKHVRSKKKRRGALHELADLANVLLGITETDGHRNWPANATPKMVCPDGTNADRFVVSLHPK